MEGLELINVETKRKSKQTLGYQWENSGVEAGIIKHTT